MANTRTTKKTCRNSQGKRPSQTQKRSSSSKLGAVVCTEQANSSSIPATTTIAIPTTTQQLPICVREEEKEDIVGKQRCSAAVNACGQNSRAVAAEESSPGRNDESSSEKSSGSGSLASVGAISSVGRVGPKRRKGGRGLAIAGQDGDNHDALSVAEDDDDDGAGGDDDLSSRISFSISLSAAGSSAASSQHANALVDDDDDDDDDIVSLASRSRRRGEEWSRRKRASPGKGCGSPSSASSFVANASDVLNEGRCMRTSSLIEMDEPSARDDDAIYCVPSRLSFQRCTRTTSGPPPPPPPLLSSPPHHPEARSNEASPSASFAALLASSPLPMPTQPQLFDETPARVIHSTQMRPAPLPPRSFPADARNSGMNNKGGRTPFPSVVSQKSTCVKEGGAASSNLRLSAQKCFRDTSRVIHCLQDELTSQKGPPTESVAAAPHRDGFYDSYVFRDPKRRRTATRDSSLDVCAASLPSAAICFSVGATVGDVQNDHHHYHPIDSASIASPNATVGEEETDALQILSGVDASIVSLNHHSPRKTNAHNPAHMMIGDGDAHCALNQASLHDLSPTALVSSLLLSSSPLLRCHDDLRQLTYPRLSRCSRQGEVKHFDDAIRSCDAQTTPACPSHSLHCCPSLSSPTFGSADKREKKGRRDRDASRRGPPLLLAQKKKGSAVASCLQCGTAACHGQLCRRRSCVAVSSDHDDRTALFGRLSSDQPRLANRYSMAAIKSRGVTLAAESSPMPSPPSKSLTSVPSAMRLRSAMAKLAITTSNTSANSGNAASSSYVIAPPSALQPKGVHNKCGHEIQNSSRIPFSDLTNKTRR